MIRVDFGSGYNPKQGFSTCDITFAPYLDYAYDLHGNCIVGLDDASVDVIRCKNVLHHIRDLDTVAECFSRYLKCGGLLLLIEPNEKSYPSNLFLDKLWYRGIIPRHEVWFSESYRDYLTPMVSVGFTIVSTLHSYIYDLTILKRGE